MHRGKAVIIGAGNVGSTICYTLMHSGIFSELALIDTDCDKACGDALDMNHGAAFVKAVRVSHGDYTLCRDADIIIITAGAGQKEGETRLDLVKRNVVILEEIIENIKRNTSDYPILLIVTNPVDVLAYAAYRLSGWPIRRVIGSGTVLDTSRLKFLLSEHTGIDARNIHTYIIGEHGDSELAVWSATSIGGLSVEQYCEKCNLCSDKNMEYMIDEVRSAAYEIIEKKGATYYAVALAVERIVSAIVNDEHSVLTVSSVLDGEYGIDGVCLSVPTVVGGEGIIKIMQTPLTDKEQEELNKSAQTLSKVLRELGF